MKKRQMVQEAVNNLKGLLTKSQLECFEVELARRLSIDDTELLDKKVEMKEIQLHLIGIEQNNKDLKNYIVRTFKYLFEERIVSISEINSTYYIIDLNGSPAYKICYMKNDDTCEIVKVEEV